MSFSNFVGSRLLPYTNPRVVAPPADIVPDGRPNIIVATPMRSGTHVLIDCLLNNLPAYKRRPLYVDLDSVVRRKNYGLQEQLVGPTGHILKSHFPITGHAETAVPLLDQCGRNGIVVAVRRDRSDVLKSIERWKPNVRDTTDFGNDYDAFWEFWEKREPLTIDFKDLFEPKKMAEVLDDICERVGTTRKASYVSAPSPNDRKKIYASKVTTRLLGRRAPLVNTTIYTLKA